MRAGVRSSRISIERAAVVFDSHGGEVETWTELAAEYAEVIYGTGRERREAAQERASVPATFRVLNNYRTRSVTPRDRIRFDSRPWDIIGAVPLGRDGIEITAVTAYEVVSWSVAASASLTGALSQSHQLVAPVVAGASVVGTIAQEHGLTGAVSAAATIVGALIGPGNELFPQPEFDDSAGLSLQNAVVSGGQCTLQHIGAGAGVVQGNSAEAISAGQMLRLVLVLASMIDTDVRLLQNNSSLAIIPAGSMPGIYSFDVAAANASLILRVSAAFVGGGADAVLESFSVKKLQ